MLLAILLQAFDKQTNNKQNRRVFQGDVAKVEVRRKTRKKRIHTIALILFTPKKPTHFNESQRSSFWLIPYKTWFVCGWGCPSPSSELILGPGWCTASSRAWCAAARRQRQETVWRYSGRDDGFYFLGFFWFLCDCIFAYVLMLYLIEYRYVYYVTWFTCLFNTVHTYTVEIQRMMIVRSIPAIF